MTFLTLAMALKTGRVGISRCFEKNHIPRYKDVQMICRFRAVLESPFHLCVTIIMIIIIIIITI